MEREAAMGGRGTDHVAPGVLGAPSLSPSRRVAVLAPACRWIHTSEDEAYLHWNYRGIATLRRRGADIAITIRWGPKELHGVAPSMARAVQDVEAWVAPRGMPPAFKARR